MSAIYQNQNPWDVVLPTPSGAGISIRPDGYVGGSYFELLEREGVLVQVDENSVTPSQVIYYYPELGTFPIPGTDITTITANEGLEGGGSGPTVTIGIADGGVTTDKLAAGSITFDKIASGNLVTAINDLTDDVQLTMGVGLSIQTVGQTLLISNISPGLSLVNATLPLSASLANSNQTLNLSLNITTTDDGGAIAKQSAYPLVAQTGHAAVTGTLATEDKLRIGASLLSDPNTSRFQIASSLGDQRDLLAFTYDNNLVAAVDYTGAATFLTSVTTTELISTQLTVGTDKFVVTETDIVIGLPTSLQNVLTIDTPDGKIINTPFINPAIELTVNDADPAVLLKQAVGSTLDSCVFLEIKDENDVSLLKLEKDGILTAKKVIADSIVSNFNYINTASTYNASTSGPQTIICNASSGNIIVQLPTLTSAFEGTVQITVKKIDISANLVSIVPNVGQTIDGQLNTPVNLDSFESKTVVGFYEAESDKELWFLV